MLLEELEQIGGQRQVVAQRLQLSLRGNYKKQNVSLSSFIVTSSWCVCTVLLCDSPAALESSSGGWTPVRQLKNSAAQRRKGLMPSFTLSATDLPDTSEIGLKEQYRTIIRQVEGSLYQHINRETRRNADLQ